MVRAPNCSAKHRWFELNSRILVGMLAHCSRSNKWVPGGNTRGVKGGDQRNWLPYLTMPAAQDKYPSNGHSPNVRIVHGTHLSLLPTRMSRNFSESALKSPLRYSVRILFVGNYEDPSKTVISDYYSIAQ